MQLNINKLNIELLKQFTQDAKKKDSIIELSHVYFNDKCSYACNGHALYKCFKPVDLIGVYDIKNMTLMENIKYPNVEKLIPEDFLITNEIIIDSQECKKIGEIIKPWSNHLISFSFQDDLLILKTADKLLLQELKIKLENKQQNFNSNFNRDLLSKLFLTLGGFEAGYTLNFCFNSDKSAMVVTIESGVTIGLFLIMPIALRDS